MSNFFNDVTRGSLRGLAARKRTVRAPSAHGAVGPPAVISVELNEDEEVHWHWTHFPDGRSLVTGYTIIKAASPE